MTRTSSPFPRRSSTIATDRRSFGRGLMLAGMAGVVAVLCGCGSAPEPVVQQRPVTQTAPPPAQVRPAEPVDKTPMVVTVREGDVLKISFPGAPKLDSTQQVRADGVVTLDVIGDVKVIGQTPKDLEKTLANLFASQLVSNEVTVTIISSSYDVYVTGAVLRPGKISATKPITAFQAIMEAGYDPLNSNLEKVILIREVARAKYTYIPLNLQLVLEGKETEPYYLKPSDTLQVPRKISIFQ